jgi:putative ABC transport system ATP-binding protein
MGSAAEEAIVALSGVRFGWSEGSVLIDLPRLEVHRAERLFLRGPSGSGKSTLLTLVAGVNVPQQGSVRVLGRELRELSGPARDRLRGDHIGFIFQMFNLIPYLSVVENVCLPCGFSPRRRQRAAKSGGSVRDEAVRLLAHLDMPAAVLRRPVTELSVGQQQRVAAARALIGSPELVIADEPTSSLDADRRSSFLDLLFAECDRERAALIFVSHDSTLSSRFHRVLELPEINRAPPPATQPQ